MGIKHRVRHRVRDAIDTVTHGYDYARHLVRGNKVRGDLSWLKPGAAPVVRVHGCLQAAHGSNAVSDQRHLGRANDLPAKLANLL